MNTEINASAESSAQLTIIYYSAVFKFMDSEVRLPGLEFLTL